METNPNLLKVSVVSEWTSGTETHDYLFTNWIKATQCVRHLLDNLYTDDGGDNQSNPLAGYDRIEQEEVQIHKSYRNEDLVGFVAIDEPRDVSVQVITSLLEINLSDVNEDIVDTEECDWII